MEDANALRTFTDLCGRQRIQGEALARVRSLRKVEAGPREVVVLPVPRQYWRDPTWGFCFFCLDGVFYRVVPDDGPGPDTGAGREDNASPDAAGGHRA